VRVIRNVGLDDLSEVNVRSKIHLDCVHVGSQGIARNLHAIPHPRRNVRNKGVSGWQIALPALERRNDFGIGVYRAKCPYIAKLKAIVWRTMTLFLADESPQFIELQLLARQVAHLPVQQRGTSPPNANAKPHNGVTMNASNALDRADAGTFCQCADYRYLLVSA
jgi:hypothetical protein